MAEDITNELKINTDQNGTSYSDAALALSHKKNVASIPVVYETHKIHELRPLGVKIRHLLQYGIIAVDSLIHGQIDILHWLDDRLFRLSERLS
jgi:hypothetical protein